MKPALFLRSAGVRCLLALLFAAVAMPALAEDDDLAGIDSITVTITKREESLQEVSSAVSAFGAEFIEDANLENLSDIAALLPNVVVKGEDRNGAISIRGISSGFTGQSAVAKHVNGIFKPRAADGYFGAYYDVASIEAQRGPSGTVYGRNATAGAINLNWNRPHDEWEVRADVTLGSYDRRQFQGLVNIPVLGEGDRRLMARFVVQREVRDGYVNNTFQSRRDDPQNKDEWYFRGALRSEMTEDLTVEVRAFYNESEAQPNVMTPLQQQFGSGFFTLGALGTHLVDPYNGLTAFKQSILTNPQSVLLALSANVALGQCAPVVTPACPDASIMNQNDALEYTLLTGVPAFGLPPLIGNASNFTPARPVGEAGAQRTNSLIHLLPFKPRLRVLGADGQLDWNVVRGVPILGDIDFVVAGGFEKHTHVRLTDADGSEAVVVDSLARFRREIYTGDARFITTGESWIDLIAGFFYYHQEEDTYDSRPFTVFGVFTGSSVTDERGWALYGSAEIRPLEIFMEDPIVDVELFGGFRYNKDKQYLNTVQDLVPGLRPAAALRDEAVFRETTWEAGIRVFLTEDHMVYFKGNKGYKPGLQQLVIATGSTAPVDPELIRTLEFGAKSVFFDGSLVANFAAFTYEYSNLQVPQLSGLQILTSNAASATMDGAELELQWVPSPEWLFAATASWLDSEYDEFCLTDAFRATTSIAVGCTGPGEFNLAGNRLEDAPSYQASLLVRYTFDLGEWGTLTPVVKFAWTDDYFRRPQNVNQIDVIESYTRTDLSLAWKSVDGTYGIEVFAQNLEDELVYARSTVGQSFAGGFPASLGFLGPRIYGLRLTYHFQD